MLDKQWIKRELINLLEVEENTSYREDQLLKELIKYSLKVVTFLARFNREYGKHPEIIEFLKNPTITILEESLNSQK